MATTIIGRDEMACRIGGRLMWEKFKQDYRERGGLLTDDDLVAVTVYLAAVLRAQDDHREDAH